jgi:photosystem II stability/assembly factor-like uncharacterized protein
MTFVESFGFADINITADGKELKLADGKKATLTYPVAASQKANAPATIPLWYYDYDKGQWIEEGAATLEGEKYVGEVSHFTPWNIDVPIETSTLMGRVVDGDGDPIANAFVWCTSQSGGWGFRTYSDENGEYSSIVEADTEIEAIAYYSGLNSQIETILTGTAGSNDIMPDLVIDISGLVEGWELTMMGDRTISDMYFLDCDNAWLVTSPYSRDGSQKPVITVYKTTDGGENWESSDMEGQWNDGYPRTMIRFRDHDLGVVTSVFGIFYTQDGGDNWQLLGNDSHSDTPMISNISFGPNDAISIYTQYGIGTTTDFGKNWVHKSHEDIKGSFDKVFYYFSYLEGQECYIFYGDKYGLDNKDFVLSSSNSYGANWNTREVTNNTFGISGPWYANSNHNGGISYPAFYTSPENNHYILANEGIFVSKDKMQTWTNLLQVPFNDPTALYMKDEQRIYAGTKLGGLYHTDDGGNTWSVFDTGSGYGAIYDIYMCGDYNGFAISGEGLLRYKKEKWIAD